MDGKTFLYISIAVVGAIIFPLAKAFGLRREKNMLRQVQHHLQANNLPIDSPSYLVYKGMRTDGYAAATNEALYMFPKAGQPYTVPYNTVTSLATETPIGRLCTLTLQLTSGQSLSFAVQDLRLDPSQESTTQSAESLANIITSYGATSQLPGSQPMQSASVPQTQIPQTPLDTAQPVPIAAPQPYSQVQPTTPLEQPPTPTPTPESTQGP